MLIESGDRWLPSEEPQPERRRWPGLRPLLRWIHVIVVWTAGMVFPGWPGVLLLFTAIGLIMHVSFSYLPDLGDLRDHRQ